VKPQYPNKLIETSFRLFAGAKIGIRKAGLFALVSVMIGVDVHGCNTEEPEGELYEYSKIVFVSERDEKRIDAFLEGDANSEIYVMNADGSEQKRLTNHPAVDGAPSWSPDGRNIVFVSDRDGNVEIYVMSADGSGQKRLTNNTAFDMFPSWSPDGKKIAFMSTRAENTDIYIMNAGGSEQRRRTEHPAIDGHSSCSPFLPSGAKTQEKN
jgi:Tol biopolymer transport system component